MGLTLYQAAVQSQNPLTAGMFLAIATSDEFISQVPMARKAGESFSYTREKSLPDVEFVAPDHSSLTESSGEDERVTVPLRLLVSDVDTYIFAEEQQSERVSQRGNQLTKKLKAAGRKIADKAINGKFNTSVTITPTIAGVASPVAGPLQDSDRHGPGDIKFVQATPSLAYRAPGDRTFGTAVNVGSNGTYTLKSSNPNRFIKVTVTSASLPGANTESNVYFASTSNEPDGLLQLVPDARIRSSTGADGDPISFAILDAMLDEVKTGDRLFFVMNSAIRRKYFELLRAMGGAAPEHTRLAGISGPVPLYRDVPILRTDTLLSNESKGAKTDLSSILLVSLSTAEEGFFAGCGGQGASTANLTPAQVRIMGLRVRSVGELQTKEAMRDRVSWYGAFGLGSELAVYRAKEIQTT